MKFCSSFNVRDVQHGGDGQGRVGDHHQDHLYHGVGKGVLERAQVICLVIVR